MFKYSIRFLLCFITLFTSISQASDAWPAEPWWSSVILTELDNDFKNNLSGAHWNPQSRTLWVSLNGPSKFWAITENKNGDFVVDHKNGVRGQMLVSGDLEGITQVDYGQEHVFLIDESNEAIQQYDVSDYSKPTLLHRWDIGATLPSAFGSGPEGITFVPDEWLGKQGFVDQTGNAYKSQYGMGGLMLVAHQNGGHIYAYDLDPNGSLYRLVGKYSSSRNESSGLEFDRSSGFLFIWHNTDGNSLEVTTLGSSVINGERTLNRIKQYYSPKGGNLEGFALTPANSKESRAFLVDDDNQDGAALMLFTEFYPDLVVDDHLLIKKNTEFSFSLSDLSENDYAHAENLILNTPPVYGRLVDINIGDQLKASMTYIPNKDYAGIDSFTYTTKANQAATVTIEVEEAVKEKNIGYYFSH
jgi:uncharacterized protein YjiK